MTTHEVLVRARNLIDKGWTQRREVRNHWFRPNEYCAIGALNAADGRGYSVYDRDRPAYDAYWNVLWEAMGMCPMAFNDMIGRTKEEVLAAFDKAIAETAPPPAVPHVEVPVEEPVEVAA